MVGFALLVSVCNFTTISEKVLDKPFKFPASPYEFKLTALRECPTPDVLQQCDTLDKTADYWRMHIASHPYFNPECECSAVLILNTRRKVKGHHIISIGTMDTILVQPREVFRVAIVTVASALIVMHNHPSGENTATPILLNALSIAATVTLPPSHRRLETVLHRS